MPEAVPTSLDFLIGNVAVVQFCSNVIIDSVFSRKEKTKSVFSGCASAPMLKKSA